MSTGHDGGNRYAALRTRAIESLLIEKGLLSERRPSTWSSRPTSSDIGPLNGARVVARAWVDPAFKERLLEDATAAVARARLRRLRLRVRASRSRTRRRSTTWSSARSARATRGACSACRRPGTSRRSTARAPCASRARCCASSAWSSTPTIEIRIWDSSAELRYIVLPERPGGHRASWRGRARGARHARRDDRHRPRRGARA